MSVEAARILEKIGACPGKIAEYRAKEGDLPTLWEAAGRWDRGDLIWLLIPDTESAQHREFCEVCNDGPPVAWWKFRALLIARGFMDDPGTVFAPIHSKAGASNG